MLRCATAGRLVLLPCTLNSLLLRVGLCFVVLSADVQESGAGRRVGSAVDVGIRQ
jgi:hypothetical protein